MLPAGAPTPRVSTYDNDGKRVRFSDSPGPLIVKSLPVITRLPLPTLTCAVRADSNGNFSRPTPPRIPRPAGPTLVPTGAAAIVTPPLDGLVAADDPVFPPRTRDVGVQLPNGSDPVGVRLTELDGLYTTGDFDLAALRPVRTRLCTRLDQDSSESKPDTRICQRPQPACNRRPGKT